MKRRKFLKIGLSTVAAAPLVFARKQSAFAQNTSPLGIAFDPNACTVLLDTNNDRVVESFHINASVVNNLVDHAVMLLTQKQTVAQAWENLFPQGSLSSSTKIGIKINQSYGWDSLNDWTQKHCPFGPKVEVVNAIVSGLTQMLDGTFPISNITVFDKYVSKENDNKKMACQGFPSSSVFPYDISGDGQYRVMLADVWDGIPLDAPGFDAGPSNQPVPQKMIPPVYQNDYWINVTIPKDHADAAGFTGTLKNTYGCTDNCDGTHARWGGPDVNLCINDFYKNITQQTPCIVHILDGLAGLYNGGPIYGNVFQKNVVAATTDPLTLDYYALDMVNLERRQHSLHDITTSTTETKNEDDHLNAPYLSYAQDVPYSFGNFNSDEQYYRDLTGIEEPHHMPALQKPQARLIGVDKVAGNCRMHVLMDKSGRNHIIESTVFDSRGRTVKAFSRVSTRLSRTTLVWDGKDDGGIQLGAGIYVWQVRADGHAFTQALRLY